MADPRDIQRLIGDLARLGTVASVDLAAGTARVTLGDIETGDIPWLAPRAGATRIWSPPSVGEQVLVLAPEGDLAGGLILGSLPSDAHPEAGDGPETTMVFADGAELTYDPEAHSLIARLPSGSHAELIADDIYLRGNLHVAGFVEAQGKIVGRSGAEVTGTLTATDDVVGGGKSLKRHVHTAVQPGQGVSGLPQ